MYQFTSLELLAKIIPIQDLKVQQRKKQQTLSKQQAKRQTELKLQCLTEGQKRRMKIFGRNINENKCETPSTVLMNKNEKNGTQNQIILENLEKSNNRKLQKVEVHELQNLPSDKKVNTKIISLDEKLQKIKKDLQVKKILRQKKKQEENKKDNNEKVSQTKLQGDQDQIKTVCEIQSKFYYISSIIENFRSTQSKAFLHLSSSLSTIAYFNSNPNLCKEYSPKTQINLPRRKGYEDKLTVIFDLDETLIHSNDRQTSADVVIPMEILSGKKINVSVNIRPYTLELLKKLSKKCEVIVYTASQSSYANSIIDYLDPEGNLIHHRLFREHCVPVHGMKIKDLRIMNRNLERVVLIDNLVSSFVFQIHNGIPILPYFEDKEDKELELLEKYLNLLENEKDVRILNRQVFKFHEYDKFEGSRKIERMVQTLYIDRIN